MRKLLYLLSLTLFCLIGLSKQDAVASHIMGGDLIYFHEPTPTEPYRFRVVLYYFRFCSGINAPGTHILRIEPVQPCPGASNQPFQTMTQIPSSIPLDFFPVPLFTQGNGNSVCPSYPTACNPGGLPAGTLYPGAQIFGYQAFVNIPQNQRCDQWLFWTTECCRNGSINNVTGSSLLNSLYEAMVNTNFMSPSDVSNGVRQNSPIFLIAPVPVMPVNQRYFQSPGTREVDGDSLAFEFVNIKEDNPATIVPYTGTGVSNTPPIQPLPTDATTAFGRMTIDPQTGTISLVPSQINRFVYGIQCNEWRRVNNAPVRVGYVRRDIQIDITNGSIPLIPGINSLPTVATTDGTFIGPPGTNTTLNFNDFRVNAPVCQTSCFTVRARDLNNPLDELSLFTTDLLTLPTTLNLTKTVNLNTRNPSVTFCVNPDPTAQRNHPYLLTALVRDDFGVSGETSVTFSIFTSPGDFANAGPDLTACGTSSVQLNVTGGGPGSTYLWSPPSGLSDSSSQFPTYVSQTCVARIDAHIAEPDPLSASIISSSGPNCANLNSGSISVQATGGTPPYAYSVNGVVFSGSPIISNLKDSTYTVIVRDSRNCVFNIPGTITLNAPPALSATPVIQNLTCAGFNNGQITVNVTGGTPPYRFNGPQGLQSSNVFPNLPPGTYNTTVLDANNCIQSLTNLIVGGATPIVVSASPTNPTGSCNANNGSITVNTPTGGTSPYQFSIDGANFVSGTAFNNLSAGRYVVYVRDANNCISTATVNLTAPGGISASGNQTNVSCNGGNNGSITITSPVGADFEYALNGGGFVSSANFTNLAAGHNSVVVRRISDGCTTNFNVRITEPRAINAQITNLVNVNCFNQNTGQIRVNAAGGTGALQYALNSGPFSPNFNFGARPAGTDTIRVRDVNNCQVNLGVTIDGPSSALTASLASFTSPLCAGENTGTLTVTASGGTAPYTFQRTGSPVQTSGTFSNIPPGGQLVVVRDANNCQVNVNATIPPPTLINATVAVTAPTNCATVNGSLTVTNTVGGTGPYTYSINGSTFGAGTTFTGLQNGRYNLFVRDSLGCERIQSVSVIAPAGVNAVPLVSNIECNGQQTGSVTISNPTGGFGSYSFSNDGVNFNSNAVFDSLSAGTNTFFVRDPDPAQLIVTITDPNGCTASDTIRVFSQDSTLNVQINGGVDSVVFCQFETVQLEATGAEAYVWTPAAGLSDPNIPNPTANPTTTTTYTVTGASGACIDSKQITVVVDNPVPLTVTNDTGICRGESLQLNATGGISYQWSPNINITGANTCCPTVNPLLGTVYTVIAESTTGCPSFDTVRVDVRGSAKPVVSLTKTDFNGIICLGDTQDITLNVFQPEILACGLNQGLANCAFGSLTVQVGSIFGVENTFSPFTNAAQGVRQQYLVRADELLGVGLGAGDISSLSFFVSDVAVGFDSLRNFTLKLKCAPPTFNQFPLGSAQPPATGQVPKFESGLSTVFSSAAIMIEQGQNKFNFDNSYYWDGESNLVVEVCYYSNNPAVPGRDALVFVEQTTFFAAIFNTETNNPFICTRCEPDGTGRRTTRPVMSFEGCKFDKNFYTYTWSNIFNTAGVPFPTATSWVTFKDTTNTDVFIVPQNTGVYAYALVIEDAFGCASDTLIDTLAVIDSIHSLVVSNDTAICFGDSAFVQASAVNGTNYLWSILRTPLAPLSASSDTTRVPGAPSDTRLNAIIRADNQGECFVQDTVKIQVGVDFTDKVDIGAYQAYFDALFDVTIPPNDTVIAGLVRLPDKTVVRDVAPVGIRFVNESINPDSIWQWSFTVNGGSSRTNFSTEIAPSYIFEEAGEYLVFLSAIDSVGCSAEDSVLISVERFILPNVITPNGDGKNDSFLITGLRPGTRMDLSVFNRWGRPVYTKEGYDNTFNGGDLEGGTYFFSLYVEEQDKTYTGWIQLLK